MPVSFFLQCLNASNAIRSCFSLLALLLTATVAVAETPAKAIKLPPGVQMARDIAYVEGGYEAQKLDLYFPEQTPENPLPLIVHIHGGGWRAGSKFPCPVIHYATMGYVVASVEYRFSQVAVFPAQIQDCQAAIRWLRANCEKYHIDPGHVGVIGGSAGGHLSALVGTSGGKDAFSKIGGNEDQSDRVQAVCDIYGPGNFRTVVQQAAEDPNVKNIFEFNSPSDPYSSLIGTRLDDQPKAEAVSPVQYVSEDNPPFLILHGDHDALVPFAQSEELAARLGEKGVEVGLQKIPGAGHGGPAFVQPAISGLVQRFFDKHLKGADVEVELLPESEVAVAPK